MAPFANFLDLISRAVDLRSSCKEIGQISANGNKTAISESWPLARAGWLAAALQFFHPAAHVALGDLAGLVDARYAAIGWYHNHREYASWLALSPYGTAFLRLRSRTYEDVAEVLGNSAAIVRKHCAKWSKGQQRA